MALTAKDIARLGPEAQRQIAEALAQHVERTKAEPPFGRREGQPGGPLPRSEFDSDLEYHYYLANLYRLHQSGRIQKLELHREFELFPAGEYGGKKLRRMVYKPDFVLEYADGSVEVIETKAKQIRKMQRDYPLRRRLFIEKYCRPNGWIFTEYIPDAAQRRKEGSNP